MTNKIEAMSSTEATGGSSSGRPLNELASELLARADADWVCLVGPGGLLSGLTKTVMEAALEAEMTEHLGYEAHESAGHHSGNNRNGSRSKSVLTDIGRVDVEMPRDRDGSFTPVIVAKRQRRFVGGGRHGVFAVRERSHA